MSKKDKFEAKVRIGQIGYDIQGGRPRGTESALFVAPTKCPDGVARHVSVIFDREVDEVYNIHLTKESMGKKWKQWSRDPNHLVSDAVSWLKAQSSPLEASTVRELGPDYLCVSGWRVYAVLRVSMGLFSLAEWVLFRPLALLGIAQFNVTEDKIGNRVRAVGSIDMTRMIAMMRKLRSFKRIVSPVMPLVVFRIGPKVGKALLLTKAERMSRGDALLLIPKRQGIEPLVLLRGDQYQRVDAATVFQKAATLYKEMELGELLPDPQQILTKGLSVPFSFESKGVAQDS